MVCRIAGAPEFNNPELTQNVEFAKVFVGGLPPTVTEHGFREYFQRHGTVTECKLMIEKRIGFVTFKNEVSRVSVWRTAPCLIHALPFENACLSHSL